MVRSTRETIRTSLARPSCSRSLTRMRHPCLRKHPTLSMNVLLRPPRTASMIGSKGIRAMERWSRRFSSVTSLLLRPFFLAAALHVLSVRALVSLDIFEPALLVALRVELRSRSAAMSCTSRHNETKLLRYQANADGSRQVPFSARLSLIGVIARMKSVNSSSGPRHESSSCWKQNAARVRL